MTAQPDYRQFTDAMGQIAAEPVAIAHPLYPAKALSPMQQEFSAGVDGTTSDAAPASPVIPTQEPSSHTKLSAAALLAVPAIVVGAACLVPLSIVTVGAVRLARGRTADLGTDAARAGQSVWRAAAAAIAAITDGSTRRR